MIKCVALTAAHSLSLVRKSCHKNLCYQFYLFYIKKFKLRKVSKLKKTIFYSLNVRPFFYRLYNYRTLTVCSDNINTVDIKVLGARSWLCQVSVCPFTDFDELFKFVCVCILKKFTISKKIRSIYFFNILCEIGDTLRMNKVIPYNLI